MKLFLLSLAFGITQLGAQEQRALIIGIDIYEPPTDSVATSGSRADFHNLNGAKNDAQAMRSVLATKYGFKEQNLSELYDRDATRQHILESFDALLAKSTGGDIAVLYYAGHGSQQRNSLSAEGDKKDETIVPSNCWQLGIADITDKELSRRFNAFLDKGIKLTVIFDCCNSGSLSRGPTYDQPVYRYLPESNYDTRDASKPQPPEQRYDASFLILSAAQSSEPSQEVRDDENNWHGVFTLSLIRAINQQSVDASALHLFTTARAILRSNGKRQEPDIRGSVARQRETLFGFGKGKLSDRPQIPAMSITATKVYFQGGYFQNLRKGTILCSIDKANAGDSINVRIDSVISGTSSYGSVVKGSLSRIEPGQAFEVGNWISSGESLLKLYIPPSLFTAADIAMIVGSNVELQQANKVKWMSDIDRRDPDVSIFYKGNKCVANIAGKSIRVIMPGTTEEITKVAAGKLLFYNLPAGRELSEMIREQFSTDHNIQVVDDANDANYLLFGTIDKKKRPAYGFMRADIASADSLGSMPLRTTAFSLTADNKDAYQNITDSLYEYALRLGKIRAWLNLIGPSQGTAFPMHLEFEDKQLHKPVDPPKAKIGQSILFHIVADPDINNVKVERRFAYVFLIDHYGNMQLIYPDPDGSSDETRLPFMENGRMKKDTVIYDGTIGAPSGTDTYFLLTTDEKIPEFGTLFNQEGVRAVETRGIKSELDDLLNMGNAGKSRGGPVNTTAKWSIRRYYLKTYY